MRKNLYKVSQDMNGNLLDTCWMASADVRANPHKVDEILDKFKKDTGIKDVFEYVNQKWLHLRFDTDEYPILVASLLDHLGNLLYSHKKAWNNRDEWVYVNCPLCGAKIRRRDTSRVHGIGYGLDEHINICFACAESMHYCEDCYNPMWEGNMKWVNGNPMCNTCLVQYEEDGLLSFCYAL